ncbi:MAG: S4 domain-containing protein [Hydrogenophilus sp.]|nr:S4 domain-containing protein [Hydrogenophilus sp.]
MAMDHFHARTPRLPPRGREERWFPPRKREDGAGKEGERLDVRLVREGLAPSRSVAQRWIREGAVEVEGMVCRQVARRVNAEAEVVVRREERFVSRAGEKLAAALAALGWSPAGGVALDVGQSTGGFTDCLLQLGAVRVVGVEVGHDQLAARLRPLATVLRGGEKEGEKAPNTPIVVLEGTNARFLSPALLSGVMPVGGFDWIVGDVSFISVRLVWPAVLPLAAAGGRLVWLIKPQFELGLDAVDRHGVVRDARARAEALRTELNAMLEEWGWTPMGWGESTVRGGGVGKVPGNVEFWIAGVRRGGVVG